MSDFKIEWIDAERETHTPPDAAWPEGIALIESPEANAQNLEHGGNRINSPVLTHES